MHKKVNNNKKWDNKKLIFNHVQDRLGHDKAYRINSSKFSKLIGKSKREYPNLHDFLCTQI